MSKNPVLYKTLVVGVIVLFIGVAVAPSIYGNVIKEEDLVEYEIEFFGINSKKQTIKLTQDEANEVDALFDDFQNEMNNIESRAEVKEIFSNTLNELHKYDFLRDLSIKQVESLIFKGMNRQNLFSKLIRKSFSEFNFLNSNLFCLIGGHCNYIHFMRVADIVFPFFYLFFQFFNL